MIARIRRGNDFHVAWQIKRGGVAENLENVTDIKLERTIYGVTTEHTLFTVSGDTITAEIPAEVQTHYGQYKLTLSYELVDTGMSDDDRKCKVAVYAFAIVDPLGPADDLLTVDVASDVSIGFKGDKGLSAYQVWLEDGNVGTEDDYFAYLRQPATDAAESLSTLEQTVSGNETARINAESDRVDAEDLRDQAEVAREEAEGIRDSNEIDRIAAEGIRDANETARINAESDRVDAEDLRDQAEVAREEAEGLRQTSTSTAIQNAEQATTAANTAAGLAAGATTAANTAAGDANNAAEAANTAAGLADAARLAIEGDLALKADQTELDQLAGEVSQKASHGYSEEEEPKTLKEVEDAKFDKTAVKQVTGTSTTDVMSQKAVTDEIAKRSGLIYEYVHSDNIEISGFTVDLATGTFTKPSHGLSNGNQLRVCLNQNTVTLFLKDVTFAEYVNTASMIRYVVNATDDTFQLSKTSGGAVETLTAVAGTDLTKWHFEKRTSEGVSDAVVFEGINALSGNAKNIRIVVTGKIVNNTTVGHFYFNIDGDIPNTSYIAYTGSGAAALRSTYTLLRADGFGTIEYDCTYNGSNLVIRKNLLMIREQNLTAYTENELFYRNRTGYTVDKVVFTYCGFTNGLTIQIYKR